MLMRISVGLLAELEAARKLLLWVPMWALLAVLLAGIVLLYQSPQSYTVDVGSPQDEAYVRNFHTRLSDGANTYRWSDVYGYIAFPGLGGSRPFTLSVDLNPARTAPVTLIVNGEFLFSGPLRPGWQTLALSVDATHPAAIASRDTVLEIRAPDYRTEDAPTEPKGVEVSSVSIEQAASGGFISPPYMLVGLLTITLLLVYLFVGRALFGIATLHRARLWGLVVALAFSVGVLLWLYTNRIALSAAAPHLFITALSILLLLVITERVAAALARRNRSGVFQRRLLALCLALGFGLRYGGMALPQSVIIDMPWHMKWLQTLLTGNWQALYFPSANGLSSVPAEWGLNVMIPKSPLFYFVAAPLAASPFDLDTSVKWLVCFLDATLVIPVYWLALRACGLWKAAVWAAALYTLIPLAFRAFAYGILPTIFAQWLAACFLVALLAFADRPWGILRWIVLTLLLTLALLAFPTVAVFLTMVTMALPLVWWLSSPKGERAALGRRYLRIPLLVVFAWLLAVVAYYGLYITPVLDSVAAMFAPKPGGGSTVRWPGGFPELLSWTAQYVVTLLPVLLGLLGLALLFARWSVVWDRRKAILLLTLWVAIAPLFVLVNYRVDMIGKHLFFAMVPVAAAGGVALWQLGRRRRWAMSLAALALFTIGWQGLIFWIERLVRASS